MADFTDTADYSGIYDTQTAAVVAPGSQDVTDKSIGGPGDSLAYQLSLIGLQPEDLIGASDAVLKAIAGKILAAATPEPAPPPAPVVQPVVAQQAYQAANYDAQNAQMTSVDPLTGQPTSAAKTSAQPPLPAPQLDQATQARKNAIPKINQYISSLKAVKNPTTAQKLELSQYQQRLQEYTQQTQVAEQQIAQSGAAQSASNPYAQYAGQSFPGGSEQANAKVDPNDPWGAQQTQNMIQYYGESLNAIQQAQAADPGATTVDVNGTTWSTDPTSVQNMANTLTSLQKTLEINTAISQGKVPTNPNRLPPSQGGGAEGTAPAVTQPVPAPGSVPQATKTPPTVEQAAKAAPKVTAPSTDMSSAVAKNQQYVANLTAAAKTAPLTSAQKASLAAAQSKVAEYSSRAAAAPAVTKPATPAGKFDTSKAASDKLRSELGVKSAKSSAPRVEKAPKAATRSATRARK